MNLQGWLLVLALGSALTSDGQAVFRLPTANQFVFEKGGESRFFAPTVGKPWSSGTFGCVRTDGHQLHEGIDILRLQTDRRGEPTDVVMSVADGTVVYINTKTGLSNYGAYIVIRHSIDGLSVHSLYAHLGRIEPAVQLGASVKSGQPIAVMGRSTNTRSAIGKDRAHLHLEFDFQLSPRYAEWHRKFRAGERNDHGNWNGRNLIGLDPWNLYLEQRRLGAHFSLARWIRGHTEVCRVFVRQKDFPWVRANPALIRQNPRAQKEGVAGWELALNFMGLPFECTPRAASEMKSLASPQVLYVNEVEQQQYHCRTLVRKRGAGWELTTIGANLISLLTF
jgi:murein DD-endopeptidase MepM/ murein hydrolase activator NlpD